jgi:hypothetical protein
MAAPSGGVAPIVQGQKKNLNVVAVHEHGLELRNPSVTKWAELVSRSTKTLYVQVVEHLREWPAQFSIPARVDKVLVEDGPKPGAQLWRHFFQFELRR